MALKKTKLLDIQSVTGVATGSSKVITSSESSDTTCFPLFVNSSTDAYQAPKLGSNLI